MVTSKMEKSMSRWISQKRCCASGHFENGEVDVVNIATRSAILVSTSEDKKSMTLRRHRKRKNHRGG